MARTSMTSDIIPGSILGQEQSPEVSVNSHFQTIRGRNVSLGFCLKIPHWCLVVIRSRHLPTISPFFKPMGNSNFPHLFEIRWSHVYYLLLFLCNKSPPAPNLEAYYLTVSVDREFRQDTDIWEVPHLEDLKAEGLGSPGGLMEAGGSTLKDPVTQPMSWYWPTSSCPHGLLFIRISKGCSSVLVTWWLAFTRMHHLKVGSYQLKGSFLHSASRVTYFNVCCSPLIRSEALGLAHMQGKGN